MVANPCEHTVYDLMSYGAGATNGGLVRGEIVHDGDSSAHRDQEDGATSGREIVAERLE